MKPHYILTSCLILSLSACSENSNEKILLKMTENNMAPVAKKVPFEMEIHGHKRIDDYYWMRDDDRKDEKVLAHLEAENAYLKKVMAHTEGFQIKLYDEIVGRIKKDDSSVPLLKKGYWYQVKFDGEKEYPIHVRRADTSQDEVILFDVNEMAEGHNYFNLSGYSISPDNNIAAFGTDILSRRIYTLQFKNLTTWELFQDNLEGTSGQAIWANDNDHVFYIKKDPQTLLGQEVFRHKLGTDQAEDVLVYEEKDDSFYMSLGKSRDDDVIYIYHDSTTK